MTGIVLGLLLDVGRLTATPPILRTQVLDYMSAPALSGVRGSSEARISYPSARILAYRYALDGPTLAHSTTKEAIKNNHAQLWN